MDSLGDRNLDALMGFVMQINLGVVLNKFLLAVHESFKIQTLELENILVEFSCTLLKAKMYL